MKQYILVIGNKFAHKNIEQTLERFSEIADKPKIVVLGVKLDDDAGIVGYESGNIEQNEIDFLYKSAKVIVFPTYYEGFGIPIMRALAAKVPVVARRLPVFDEIRQNSEHAKNIHLVETTQDIVDLALTDLTWQDDIHEVAEEPNWDSATRSIERAMATAIERFELRNLRNKLRIAELGSKWLSCMESGAAVVRSGVRPVAANIADAKRIYEEFSENLLTEAELRHLKATLTTYATTEYVKLSQMKDRRRKNLYDNVEIHGCIKLKNARTSMEDLLEITQNLKDDALVMFSLRSSQSMLPFVPRTPPDHSEIVGQIRTLCSNACLYVYGMSIDQSQARVLARKVVSWSKDIDMEAGAIDFMNDLYRAAFGRDADGSSLEWFKKITDNESKYKIAKKILTSKERIRILTEGSQASS